MRITGNQNLILLDVEEAWKADIATTLGDLAGRRLTSGSILCVLSHCLSTIISATLGHGRPFVAAAAFLSLP